MSAVLDALATTYPNADPPTISFQSLNAEDLPEISESHNVTAVPFIVLVRDGHTLEEISGGDAAKVRAAVEKHHASANGTAKTNGASLPPAQQVTRPAKQPLPQSTKDSNAEAADPLSKKSDATETSASKNLSAYSPNAKDPATAPEYSSKTTPALGTNSGAQNDTNGGADSKPEQDLQTRLKQLTTAAPVMLFIKGTPSAPQCGFSRQLVSILRENSVRYGFFNILADEEVRQGLKEYADWPTFPQLWMGGELVGGLDIVKEEIEGDAGFFADYAVDNEKKNQGGPAGAEKQSVPT